MNEHENVKELINVKTIKLDKKSYWHIKCAKCDVLLKKSEIKTIEIEECKVYYTRFFGYYNHSYERTELIYNCDGRRRTIYFSGYKRNQLLVSFGI